MKLADVQNLFQRSVLEEEPDPALLAQLRPPRRAENIAELFAVYHEGFRLRMAEFLATDFSVLREAVGDQVFGAMIEAFIAARPSRFRNARWFAAALPDFLRETAPFREERFGCGVAALEGALARAFDAADDEPLQLATLAATPQQDWPHLVFSLHPSVALIAAPPEALAAYAAILAGDAFDATDIALSDEAPVLVWRQGLETRYRPLDQSEALALREAALGKSFGQICDLLSFAQPLTPPEDLSQTAARYLVGWFDEGLIVGAARLR